MIVLLSMVRRNRSCEKVLDHDTLEDAISLGSLFLILI
jgi:hypothetical protein